MFIRYLTSMTLRVNTRQTMWPSAPRNSNLTRRLKRYTPTMLPSTDTVPVAPPDGATAALVLADSKVFWGRGLVAAGLIVGEVCFQNGGPHLISSICGRQRAIIFLIKENENCPQKIVALGSLRISRNERGLLLLRIRSRSKLLETLVTGLS